MVTIVDRRIATYTNNSTSELSSLWLNPPTTGCGISLVWTTVAGLTTPSFRVFGWIHIMPRHSWEEKEVKPWDPVGNSQPETGLRLTDGAERKKPMIENNSKGASERLEQKTFQGFILINWPKKTHRGRHKAKDKCYNKTDKLNTFWETECKPRLRQSLAGNEPETLPAIFNHQILMQ